MWRWLEGEEFNQAFEGIADDAHQEEMARREPMIQALASRIAGIKKAEENANFLRQARYEDGCYDDDGYDDGLDVVEDFVESERVRAARAVDQRVEEARKDAELNVLYSELARLGARMARPYEHWNEEEKLMEYLERER